MKTLLLTILIAGLGIFASCTNENEDDLSSDCSQSDLAVELGSSTIASCSTGGGLTVVGSGGTGSYTYSLDNVSFSANATFPNLSAGSYKVFVKDDNGCTASVDVVIEAEANTISIEVESTNSSCTENTGVIQVTATGGSGNEEYSIDGSTFIIQNEFSSLAPGDYTVTVKDGECQVQRAVKVLSDVSLLGDIMPIIDTNCAISGCHRDARSPLLINKGAIIGSAIRIQARTTARTMPPSGRTDLTDEQINKIACWVNDGALDN